MIFHQSVDCSIIGIQTIQMLFIQGHSAIFGWICFPWQLVFGSTFSKKWDCCKCQIIPSLDNLGNQALQHLACFDRELWHSRFQRTFWIMKLRKRALFGNFWKTKQGQCLSLHYTIISLTWALIFVPSFQIRHSMSLFPCSRVNQTTFWSWMVVFLSNGAVAQ